MVSAILFLIALLMMLGAVLSMIRARKQEQIAKVHQRLAAVAFLPQEAPTTAAQLGGLTAALDLWLKRVGLNLSPNMALTLLAGVVLMGVMLWQNLGALVGVGWAVLATVVIVLVPQVRYRQKVNRLVEQIPLFIDQVVRGLVTGRNIEGAIKMATEDLREPLRGVVQRAQQNVELGADLGDAFREAAQFYDVKELHLLALTIHSSRVYGGSPREMLESIVGMIRQRQQAQEELKAMTGETRVTAWVLGLTPGVLVAYMLWQNPKYMLTMWESSTGQGVLVVAAALQALGALIMWRMIKSL